MPTGAAAPPCRCPGCAGDRRVISSACALPVSPGVIQLQPVAAARPPCSALSEGEATAAPPCRCRGYAGAGGMSGRGLRAASVAGVIQLEAFAAATVSLLRIVRGVGHGCASRCTFWAGCAGAVGLSGRGLRGLCCWGDPAGSVCGSCGLLAPHCPRGRPRLHLLAAAVAALGPRGCLAARCAARAFCGDPTATGGGSYGPLAPHCLALMQRVRLCVPSKDCSS